MEGQSGLSELPVISWVSAFQGCPLSGVPLYIHSLTPALTQTLIAPTLALTLTLNHLANESLQSATLQYGLMYLTDGSATDYKYSIGCATDYWGEPERVGDFSYTIY